MTSEHFLMSEQTNCVVLSQKRHTDKRIFRTIGQCTCSSCIRKHSYVLDRSYSEFGLLIEEPGNA